MTHHKICDECETVAHCSNHGCIPKVPASVQEHVKDNSNYRLDPPRLDPLYTTPPAEQRNRLTSREIHTAYVAATNQTLRPQDERIVFAFTRAIEDAHGIKE